MIQDSARRVGDVVEMTYTPRHSHARCASRSVGALLFSLAAPLGAQNAKLDVAVQAEMDKWHSPGAAIAVVQKGRTILLKGYGMADRAKSTPATPDTRFYIGSMSKQFTAAAVMMLVESGQIALDEKAVRYLTQLPVSYGSITVRQLLNHTSGVQRDFKGGEPSNGEQHSLVGSALYRALATSPLAFPPGTRAGYSNTEYILLGMMIEAVSGQRLGEFLSARIFKPLGMTRTSYVAPGMSVGGLATGYEWMDGRYQEISFVPLRFGAGALVSTAADLVKWDAALNSETLLKRASLELLWTTAKLNNGEVAVIGADDAGRVLESGMGWFNSVHFGHRVVHHGGNIDGYSAQIDRFVDDQTTVIVLANNEAHAAINIGLRVIEQYVPKLDYARATSRVQLGRLAYGESRFAEAAGHYVAAIEQGDTDPSTAFNAARSFAQIGQKEKSFFYLTRAATLGYSDLARLNSESSLNSLRTDSRWPAIAQKVSANHSR